MDISNFSKDGAVSTPNGAVSNRWWTLKGEDLANSVAAIAQCLFTGQSGRLAQMQISGRLYGNLSLFGQYGISAVRAAPVQTQRPDRISYNVIQSAIDAATAKIAKNKPAPYFLTSGGNYAQQRRAKKLTKFAEGILYENKAYELGPLIFRDACVFGDGCVHVDVRHGRVKFERVLPSEIYTDELEGFYGSPRQMHRVKAVDRHVLMDLYPNVKGKINMLNNASSQYASRQPNASDLVVVSESWHLPSGPDASDGLHCTCADGHVLFQEKWTRQDFPFAFFQWSKRMYGFWGQGAAEQIQNLQLEINKLLWVIQRTMHLAGSFKIFIENGSKIVTEHLNNDIGSVVKYTGVAPQYVVPPMIQPEYFSQLTNLKNLAYEQLGISQLSASSQKPVGLNSGKALREYNDIESDRFSVVGQAYEAFFLRLADLAISAVRDAAEEEGGYKVKSPGTKALDDIDWKDVQMDKDDFVTKCYPVSSLPNDPAGRLQTVQEYVQAGWLTPRQGKKLMDFPDLDQVENLSEAEECYLTKILDKIVDEGEYTPPEPLDDLATARELAMEYYATGKLGGLEDERLDMLRRFMEQLNDLQQIGATPSPPALGPPEANPMKPERSDLLQNTPGAPGEAHGAPLPPVPPPQ